ncbi:hypothetical protein [Limosilactobacillus walteri]|uniref:Uncharacterized protein n=1 Tax=Limosilactobacillus walteri TaxID=2268022 RepID=A0ABR8P3B4_9LACO|nr:hypothetical protein [Limosilactobacillus walteri]MBD5805507.1 hypothetical protein [Limosilactobacillus walteri]
MKTEKSYRELKTELYSGYFVCFLFLCGVIFRDSIPWSWLRIVIVAGFIVILVELVSLQYKFFKFKRHAIKKDQNIN